MEKTGRQLIVETDVQNVVALGGRTIAVTGLAHMMFNNGVLLDVSRRAGGPWVASPWRRLPGAPGKSWLTTTGELLVDVYRGGTILVTGRFHARGVLPSSSLGRFLGNDRSDWLPAKAYLGGWNASVAIGSTDTVDGSGALA